MVEETLLNCQARMRSWREAKEQDRSLTVLTAYDYPAAKLVEEAGVDMILVGDTLGMVELGYPDTTHVTMEDMIHHLRAVVRGASNTLICADLPFETYVTPHQAVDNAGRLIEAGAHAVKLEGGNEMENQVRGIVNAGFPFIGHLGMLPQQILVEGKYRKYGKTEKESTRLVEDARILEDAGASGIVLECIVPEVTEVITASLSIPTIGIGSGPQCDGQVLVLHDLIGLFPWFRPKFAEPAADVAETIRQAVRTFRERIESSRA